MKKFSKRALALLLAAMMCIGLMSSCQSNGDEPNASASATPNNVDEPLVVGYAQFSEKFSPFFADSAYDRDVADLTQVMLLTTDRSGGIIYNAIEGETVPYNGTDYTYTGIADLEVNFDEAANQTTYTWTLREGVKFSDGEELTADDVIFTYYVYSDPTYDGSATLYSLPIIGMQNYRTQTTDEIYDTYSALADGYYAAGRDGVSDEMGKWYWETGMAEAWADQCQTIVNYVLANYAGYFEENTGYTSEEIMESEALQIAAGMALWGYASVADGVVTGAYSGETWNAEDTTIDNFVNETMTAYGGDPEAFFATEQTGEEGTDVVSAANDKFISHWGPLDESLGGEGIANIAGITKVNDYQVTVVTEGYDATAVYSLGGIEVAPLHYYGDESKYDYENNKFGFDYGDLSTVRAKTTQPMGAGPYMFDRYENKIVYFNANPYYWKGEPKIASVQFMETQEADKISGVGTGTIDLTDPAFGTSAEDQISKYNSNGEITGDVISTSLVNNLGYGYVGLNADTMNVGGDPDSEASKNLRRAFATMIAVYRDVAVDSYFGESASVINYSISDTSWAAPKPGDEGYRIAFSTDVNGDDIYTSDMTAEDRYSAALDAALGFFEAAGYTVTDGKLTAAPEGAKLEYEVIVPGQGAGNHPAFMLFTMVKEALAEIGMNLIINDPTDDNVLWNAMEANTHEMWCAAWSATIDPDMYQVYHSSNALGNPGGTSTNYCNIEDADLDELIMLARKSDDQSYRKTTYKACLDIIIDWAVEVPFYQRQNCVIYSSERINVDTMTPDITTFYTWMSEIEKIEMN